MTEHKVTNGTESRRAAQSSKQSLLNIFSVSFCDKKTKNKKKLRERRGLSRINEHEQQRFFNCSNIGDSVTIVDE